MALRKLTPAQRTQVRDHARFQTLLDNYGTHLRQQAAQQAEIRQDLL